MKALYPATSPLHRKICPAMEIKPVTHSAGLIGRSKPKKDGLRVMDLLEYNFSSYHDS